MRRKDLDGKYPHEIEPELAPGDYAYALDPGKGLWIVRAPNGDEGSLLQGRGHEVVEHEDGTITVSPSIQFETGQRWHGYLKAGKWGAHDALP